MASLAVAGGVIAFYKLGEFRTLGSHEVFAAVTAREMLNSGDWVVPRFGGMPRLEKPPLAYWAIALSATVFDGVNEWTVRFPAAVSALLLAALMGIWARRWYGPMAGIAAAFVQLTSVHAITFARKAEVDMLLCLLTTLAMFLIADQPDGQRWRRSLLRWTVIYALLSLAWLAKFHYGPTMVLVPAVVYFLIQKRYRALLQLASPGGLAMLAVAVGVWPYLLLQQIPDAWQVWRDQTVGRAIGDLGNDPIWFYVPHLLLLTLPWTPWAVWSMPASWRSAWMAGPGRDRYLGIALWKHGDARERFLWVWLLVVFAVVTASANKHMHYVMAALPVFSLFAAKRLAKIAGQLVVGRGVMTRRAAAALATVFVLAGGGMAMGLSLAWPRLASAAVAIGGVLAIGGCAVVWSLCRQRSVTAAYIAVVVFLGCYIGAIGWIVPGRDHRRSTAEFATAIRKEMPVDSQIGVYGLPLSSIVYYLDEPVYRVETADAVRVRLHADRKLLLVTHEKRIDELAALGEARLVKHMTADHLVIKSPPGCVLIELKARNRATLVGPARQISAH